MSIESAEVSSSPNNPKRGGYASSTGATIMFARLPLRSRACRRRRDPATMPVSTLLRWRGVTGQQRVEGLQFLAELGLNRILTDNVALLDSDEPLYEYVEDCKAAGVELLA